MMSKELPQINLNSIQDVDRALERFKLLVSDNDISTNEIKKQFFEEFGAFFIVCKYYKPEFFNEIPLFRARPVEQVDDTKDVNEYGAPPIDKDCGIGRANLNEKNVFYGSSQALGALLETKKVYEGKQFYVGRWIFNNEKYDGDEIAVSSYLNAEEKTKSSWEEILLSENEEQIEFLKRYYGDKKAPLLQHLIQELGKLFLVKDETFYPITAFLADQVVYSKNHPVLPNFLVYPSVIDDTFLNMALHPNFVKKYFTLEKIMKIQVKGKLENNTLEVLPLEIGVNENESITYYRRSISLEDRFFEIKKVICGCGKNIVFDDPEKLLLTDLKSKSKLNLREVVSHFLSRGLANPDYKKILGELFENDGVALGFKQPHRLNLKDWSINDNDVTHDSLIAECVITQHFKFTKLP